MANVQVTMDMNVKFARLQLILNRFQNGVVRTRDVNEAIEIVEYLADLLEARRAAGRTMAMIRILRAWIWFRSKCRPPLKYF